MLAQKSARAHQTAWEGRRRHSAGQGEGGATNEWFEGHSLAGGSYAHFPTKHVA